MDRGGAFVILALIPKRFGSFALTQKTEEGKQADANFFCWSTEKNEKQRAWFCRLMLHSGTPEQAEMTSGSYRRWCMTLSALFLTHTRLKTLATNTTANIQASGDVIFDLHILTATFFPQSAAHLIDPSFIDRIRRKISVNCTHENDYYNNASPPSDHFGTTHVSVVDEDGLAVSATSTINEMWAGRCRIDPLVLCVIHSPDRAFSDLEGPFILRGRASSWTTSCLISASEQTPSGRVKSLAYIQREALHKVAI